MRLVAVSTVKNESDIVEAFVRHTASIVDHHLIVDNGSTDATREILNALVSEGVALRVFDDASPGAWHARRLTRLMHEAASEHAADWVIPLDADEFVVTRRPRAIRRALKKSSSPVIVPWQTYVPDDSDDAGEPNPVRRICHRVAAEGHRWVKVMVPGELATVGQLHQGSHDVSLPSDMATDRTLLEGVRLAHFPVRSVAQFARKVAIGKIQYLARDEAKGLAFHYEEPFSRLLQSWEDFAAGYWDAAARFALPPGTAFEPVLVRDPIGYRGGSLRYTPPPRPGEPWVTILEYTMQLAAEVRRQWSGLDADRVPTRGAE
ncbi:MAG TPA: glycosyltransferase family 2 protein [Acidimicrobiia bacterium]|nr:glycosyltransferase family 2 protein [Acidimicrobiia bacterium]